MVRTCAHRTELVQLCHRTGVLAVGVGRRISRVDAGANQAHRLNQQRKARAMRIALGAALAASLAAHAGADPPLDWDIWRAFKIALHGSEVRPWGFAFEVFECNRQAAKKLAARDDVLPAKLRSLEAEAAEAWTSCHAKNEAFAVGAKTNEVAALKAIILRENARIISTARPPRSPECALLGTNGCLLNSDIDGR
jgi:hypothetical protein